MRRTLRLGAAVLSSSLLAASAAAPPIKLQGLPAAEFKKLPPEALLDVDGRALTKSQFLSENSAKARQADSPPPAKDFAGAEAKIDADEGAQMEGAKSKARASWEAVKADAAAASAAARGAPRIEQIGPQPILSGGHMIIRGSGFGSEVGEVHLLGPFPGGHLTLATCVGTPWTECNWKPHAILTWPPSGIAGGGPRISGVPDGELRVVVVTKSGQRSAPFPVSFRARRVLKRLRAQDVTVRRSNPSEGACWQGGAGPNEFGPTIGCTSGQDSGPTAWHVGIDRVNAELGNGWTFDSRSSAFNVKLTSHVTDPVPFGLDTVVLSYGANRSSATVTCGYVSIAQVQICSIELWAVGPQGVPFR